MLTVTASLAAPTAWAEAGHTVASASFTLAVCPPETCAESAPLTLTETRAAYRVEGKTAQDKPFACTIRRDTGMLTSLTVRCDRDFSFCATDYDLHAVARAAHRKDLVPMSGTDLYLDYRMSGVGSASCGGQQPVPACRIRAGDAVDFRIRIEL